MDSVIRVAEEFGGAVVRGDFEAAYALLTTEAQRAHSAATLKAEVSEMIAYAEAPLRRASVMHEVTMVNWSAKKPGDIAWVYISLEGDSFAEAVAVIIAYATKGTRIREIEWGRP